MGNLTFPSIFGPDSISPWWLISQAVFTWSNRMSPEDKQNECNSYSVSWSYISLVLTQVGAELVDLQSSWPDLVFECSRVQVGVQQEYFHMWSEDLLWPTVIKTRTALVSFVSFQWFDKSVNITNPRRPRVMLTSCVCSNVNDILVWSRETWIQKMDCMHVGVGMRRQFILWTYAHREIFLIWAWNDRALLRMTARVLTWWEGGQWRVDWAPMRMTSIYHCWLWGNWSKDVYEDIRQWCHSGASCC